MRLVGFSTTITGQKESGQSSPRKIGRWDTLVALGQVGVSTYALI